ncbi:HYR domain protein [Acinetobacter stercoris]|uniref:HYR domain protein n=1 Tax=Acinetobacter stercoris TaxID=2126983 RepID=A0A2U3N0F4_9GAMM|nr:Ig-like domain-containing protein [Acinetobacter stercoris]SPL71105.1 HYR domain protein [Acinetobacter stercoris]
MNNALIIHFKDGEVLRIENYYDDQNTLDNSLVLKEDGGQLIWIQKLENIGVIDNEIHYQVLDNVEPLLYNEDGSQYAAALPWLTGGVLVAAIAYHDKDHSQPNKTQFPELEQVKTYIDNFGSKKGEFGVVLPTDDTTPDFKIGSIPDNLTPVLYVDGKEVESEYDRTTGLLTPKESLSEGKHTIEYSLIDGSGSESPKSPEVTITIDTTSPDKPDSITNYVDDVGSIKEKFSFETVTDDTTPSFVIGTIPDDETITLYVDGKPVESTYDKDKGTLTPKVPLSEGDHEISYSLTDEVGNESELSEPVVITVDTTAPGEVVITDVLDNEINLTGPLNSGDYTNDSKPTLSGSGAEPNALITLKDETGKVIGTATADSQGNWSVEPSDANKLSDGPHTLNVTQTDKAGNESPADSFDVIVDTILPNQSTSITEIWDDVAPEKDVVISNNDYSNDTSPTLKGTISGQLQSNEFIAIYRDGELIAKLNATDLAGNTDWSYTDKDLENGKSYQYLARVEDQAGNEGGDSNKYTINIDTDPPKQTVEIETVTDNVGASTGNFHSGEEIDDSEPTLNGSVSSPLAANEVIAIYRDGVRIGEIKLATGVVSWSYTDRGLSDKTTYKYTARVEDASGQQGPESGIFSLTLNTGGSPNIALIDSIMDDVAPQIGDITQFANDGYTNDTSPLLQGHVVINDSQAVGEKVAIYRDGVKITEVEIDPVTHKWSYQEKDLQDGKEYRYKVVVVSAAGVEGAKSVESVIHIDTTQPPQVVHIETVYDNKLPVVDDVDNGGTTNDSTPELIGTLSQVLGAGEELVIYRNGVELKLNSDSLIINGTKWSYTDSSLEDRKSYTYTAFVRDKAGNESAVSNAYTIKTQFEVGDNPVQIIRIIDDVEPKTTNKIDNGGSTNDKTPTLEGSLDKALSTGEVLVICRNGDEINTVTVANGSTSWRYEDSLSVDDSYIYTAYVRDAAGNKTTTSSEYKIVLDTVPPPAMAEIVSYLDDVAPQQGTYLSGTITNDSSPTLNISVTGSLAEGDVVAVYRDGVKVGNASLVDGIYKFTDKALVNEKAYTYTVRIEDAAGNQGQESDKFILTFDLTPPPQPVDPIKTYVDDIGDKTGSFTITEITDDTKPAFVIDDVVGVGETPYLYIDDKKVDAIYDAASGTLTPVEGLADGNHKVAYSIADEAGNESVQSPESIITILSDDSPPPPKPTQYVDDVDPIQGIFGTGTSTNDTTPGVIIGTVPAGNTPALYVDGAKVEANYDPIAGTLTPKNPLLEGEHNITYTLTNPAGNESPKSDPIKVIVDTTPPDQPVATKYLDNVDPIQGEFGTGTLTNDATPGIIIGTVPAGETPTLYVDGVKVEADYDPVAKTLTPKTSLPDGEHNLSYTLTDQAGNESLKSDPIKVIVDASPIDQPTTPTQYVDNVDPVQGTFGTGTSTNDAMPSVIIGAVPVGNTPSLYVDGNSVESVYDPVTSTLTPKVPLGEGEHNLSYTLTNPTGTESPKSDPIKIIVDITAPDQPTTPTQYLDNVDPNQGVFATGTQTNDATPSVVIGVVPEGETPKLYVDGQPVESVYDAVEGTLTPKEPLADGEHNLSYTLTDPAGNESVQSDPIKVIIDTVPPDQPNAPTQYIDDKDPQTGTFDTDTPTNDPTPSIIIDPLKDGETAILYVDDKPVESIYDAEKGTLTPIDPLDEGSHDITYSVVDVAGNESLQSDPDHPLTIVIDTIVPDVLTITSFTDNWGNNQGTYSDFVNTYTNDRTPTLNGTSAEPGALITLKDETNKVLGTAIADINGQWSITPTDDNTLDRGEYQKTLYVTETDKAGNVSAETKCVLNIDTFAYAGTQTLTTITDILGNVIKPNSIIDPTTLLVISGTIEIPLAANEKVLLMPDKFDSSYGVEVTMLTATTWTVTIDPMNFRMQQSDSDMGFINFMARVVDAAGNDSGDTRAYPIKFDLTQTSDEMITPRALLLDSELTTTNVDNNVDNKELISNVIPQIFNFTRTLQMGVMMADNLAAITGIRDDKEPLITTVLNNGYTDDTAPLLEGSLTSSLSTGETVGVYRDGVKIGTAEVSGTTWSYQDSGLLNGNQYKYTVAVENSIGVKGTESDIYLINVDNGVSDANVISQDESVNIFARDAGLSQVITITEIYDNKGPGIGVIAEGNVTNDDLPEIRGSLSQPLATGEAVYILRNGVEVGEATVTGTEWTFEDGGLGSRQAYTYTAIIKDIDGNIISTSNIYVIQTNFDDPDDFISINYVNDNVSPITGLVDHNGYTNDTTPTVEGVLKLSVSYDKLVVYRDGLEVGEATVQGDTWKFADDLSLSSQGEHKYQVKAFDGTTEVSTSNEFIINFDTVAPSATVTITSYHDDISPLTGDFLSNSSTNDTSPTLNLKVNGVIGSNESVYVYRDGQYIGKATLVSGSDYQFIDNSLEDGQTYTYTTRVVDAAGNAGVLSSEFNITVDLTPPAQPVAPMEYIDDIGSIQGTFGTDTVTDDTKPALKIGITDETPTLYVDGVKVAATYDPVEGTLTPVTALTDGSHDLSYTLTDAAGNESIESEAVTVIVDTVPPVQPVSPSEYIDNVDPLAGTFVTDTTTNDTTPSLIIGAVAVDETPTLYVDGQAIDSVYDAVNGTLTPVSALGDGSHDLSYTLTDIAGNESLPSGSIAIIIDTIAPTANANIKNYIDDTGLITGEFLKDTITDDTSPTLNININAALGVGETVQIFRDGIYVGTAVEVANKKYQFTDNTSGLIDGKTYKYSACVIDTAGNQGKMSGNFKITIDLTPPDQPNAPTAYIDNVDPAQGTFASNTVTNDTTPSIIIDPLGADEISASLYINGVKVNAIYDIATNTLTPVDALPDGSYSATYTVIDSTGIESQQSAPILFTVDTIAPDKPAAPTHYYDNTGLVQGEFTVDTITDDTTPGIIIGQLPTGTSSMLFVNGKPVDAIYDPSTGYLTPIEPLTDGEHEFSYILLDQAKNQSAQSDPVVITISTKPDVSDVTTTFNLSVDTADGVNAAGYTSTITASNNDFITRDNTPEISGVLNRELKASEMLQVSEDGGVTWSDVTVLDGVKWKYISDAYSTDTILNYAFRVRDQFGSFSDILTGQDRRVVVDLTAPDALVMQPALSAKSDLNSTFTFTSDQYGKIEPGTKIAIVQDVNDNDMWQEGLDKIIAYAVADDQGQWTISTKLPAGDISVGFMLWDQAGNASALSPTTTTMVTASPNNAEVITTNWGGTTDGDGYGVNAAAVTINEDGSYSFWQSVRGTTKTNMAYAGRVYSISEDIYSASSSYLAEPSASYRKGFGGFVASAVFADINRDGYMDVMSQVSDDNDSDTTPYWINNGDGTYTGKLFNQGTTTHIGGVIAYDRTGDFYIDFVAADSCSDSLVFIKNNGGTLVLETTKEAYSYSEAVYSYVYKKVGCYYKYVQVVTYETRTGYKDVNGIASSAMTITNGLGTGSVTGKAMPKDLSLLHDIAAVDLDNNGTVDLVAHVDYNGGSSSAGDSSRGMGVLYNSGTAAGFTYINKANIFTNDGGTDYGNLPQTILFADFNGDGWLDMYLNRGSKGGVNSDESRIYLNDGKGQLNATDTQALWFGDKLAGGTAFAIDWNLDGKADIVEVPTQVAGSIQSGFAPTLYLNHGNNVWGSDAIALTGTKYSDITGAMAVDYDWDGAVDLVLSRAGADASVVASTNSAPTVIVRNTNVAADGTSLHFKIVDSKGVNSFYGNTVKLYDSKGELVATQVINPQSAGSTDSTALVHFYRLDPNETYSLQMLRIAGGINDNVGGLSNLGGYTNVQVNSDWTGLVAGKAYEAHVLTTETNTAVNNSNITQGVVGTGYNDHFYATLGNDKYNGAGGWKTSIDGTKTWVADGGQDVLDYSSLNGQVDINVVTGVATKVINGVSYTDTFENIEQFVAAKGNTTFTGDTFDNTFVGGTGNDVFNIASGGSDTIVLNLLDDTNVTGGNGSDVINGFHIGKVGTDSHADIINIHDLLDNYAGTASLYKDTDSLKLDIASSDLNKYLQVTNDGTNTYVKVDLNGTGHDYATVLTLHDVKTDLLTLLANNQLVI